MDILESSLAKLVEFIQAASPVVWQTALRQAQTEAITFAVMAVILLLAACFSGCFACYYLKRANSRDSDWNDRRSAEDRMVIQMLISGGCLLLGVPLGGQAFRLFYNPAWYAMKLLLEMVQGG